MTKEKAIYILKNTAWLSTVEGSKNIESAIEYLTDLMERKEATVEAEKCSAHIEDSDGKRYIVFKLNHVFTDITDIRIRLDQYGLKETKHGEWQVYYDEDSPQDGIWKCSICNYIRLIDDISPTRFCPNCGADMRGEEDEIQGKK